VGRIAPKGVQPQRIRPTSERHVKFGLFLPGERKYVPTAVRRVTSASIRAMNGRPRTG
jgi:hypothetical protein